MSFGKAKPHIPAAMRGVCFECGQRGHFGRDCPVRKANDGRRGKKRVKFAPPPEEEEDDDDEDPLAFKRRRGPEAEDSEDEDGEGRLRGLEDMDEGHKPAADDDDDDDDAPARPNMEAAEGEEEDTGERFNEVGEKIEPFNLRSERANDGFFDGAGNFVWKKGDREPDAWLADLDEAAVEAAVGERLARDARREAMDEDSDGGEEPEKMDAATAARAAAALLEPGETVAAGVRRLGRALKANRKDAEAKNAFEALTSAADALVGAGRAGCYEETREELEKAAAPAPPPRKVAKPGDARQWEYRARDGKVYGPYSTQTVLDWQAQGFLTGDGGAPMREYVAPPEKSAKDELAGDLEDSDDEAPPADHNPNRWLHSDDIDLLGDGAESPLP